MAQEAVSRGHNVTFTVWSATLKTDPERFRSASDFLNIVPYDLKSINEEDLTALVDEIAEMSPHEGMVAIAKQNVAVNDEFVPILADIFERYGPFDVVLGDSPAAMALQKARNVTAISVICIGIAGQ